MKTKNDSLIAKLFRQTLFVMIIAELSTSLATLLDGVIIARFLSTNAIAAYGLTSPYTSMIKMLGGFFGTGTQIVFSSYAAKFQKDKANNVFSITALLLLIFSLIISVLMFIFAKPLALALGASKDAEQLLPFTAAYLKGLAIGTPFQLGVLFLIPLMNIDGDKKRIALSLNVMMVTNLIGDLVVAFCFDGNIFGMALTTSISSLCAFVVLILHFKSDTVIRFTLHGACFDNICQVSKHGIVPAVTRSFSMIRSYILNVIIISFAGTSVLAANSLVQSNIKIVPTCIVTAIGSATLSLVSVLYPEKDKPGLKQVLISTLKISFGPCLIISVLTFVFADKIAMLFGAGETVALVAQALRFFIIGLPFIGIKMFYIYYFQASGHKVLSYYSSVTGELVFLVSSAYILITLFGTIGLWICYPVSEMLYLISVFIIATVKCKHIPHSINDFLFLGDDFEDKNIKVFYKSIRKIEDYQELSVSAIDFCTENGIDAKTRMSIGLVIEEVSTNIFEHNQDSDEHYVDVKIILEKSSVTLSFRDDCRPFNPKERIAMLDDSMPEHNIGLRIISKKAKSMQYVSVFNLNNFVITL